MENENIQPTPPPTPIQKPVTPVEEKKFKLSKLALVGLAILAVLLIAGGAYLLGTKNNTKSSPAPIPVAEEPTPTPDPTANWKTYNNTEIGYSFKYPMAWYFYSGDSRVEVNPNSGSGIFYLTPNKAGAAEIELDVNSTADTANIQYQTNQIKNYTWSNKSVSNVKIDGNDAVKVSGKQNGVENTAIVFERNGYIYELQTLGNYSQVLDQLLSTFKFTNAADETANWKTYTNPDYGFKFKYPPKFTLAVEKSTYKGIYDENIDTYGLRFSTGIKIKGVPDMSGFFISVGPNKGKTIAEYYKGRTKEPYVLKKVTPYGNAVEAAEIAVTSTRETDERYGINLYRIIGFQNANLLPDFSDAIDEIAILNTLEFTQ